ncbi:MAG: hypothetical protein B6D41_10185, partial [Chloroflexi bacterium UTCFX4]
AEAFSTRDENGRIPIVVICEREIRVLSSLLMVAGLVIVAGIFADTLFRTSLLTPLGIVAGLLLVALVGFNASGFQTPKPVFKGSPNLIFLAMKSSDSDERSQIPRQTRHQIEGLTRHVWRNCSSRPFSFVTRRTTQAFEMPRFSVRKIRFSQPLKTG